MGLAYETILHLITLRRSGRLPDRARVIEIGAQQLSNSFLRADAPLAELYGLFGRKPVDLGATQEAVTIDGVERQAESAPVSQPFWEALGFSYNAVEYAATAASPRSISIATACRTGCDPHSIWSSMPAPPNTSSIRTTRSG